MNIPKLISYYDSIISDDIFGSITNTKYKTDCFKYCPYFKKRGNRLVFKLDYKQSDIINDYNIYNKEWDKNNNYKLFLEAFEIIEPTQTIYYDSINDLKMKLDKINKFMNEIRVKTKAGAGMFFSYDQNLLIMNKIIEYNLTNFQTYYLFNYLFKQIIYDINSRIDNFKSYYRYKNIWSEAFIKYLEYYYDLNWFMMF